MLPKYSCGVIIEWCVFSSKRKKELIIATNPKKEKADSTDFRVIQSDPILMKWINIHTRVGASEP